MAKDRIADIAKILQEKMPCVILSAAGSDRTHMDESYRMVLFLNHMPIGIDSADSMDYKSLGDYEVDLPAFVARLKAKYNEPIIWICPKNTEPFSLTSFFPPNRRVFSDKFVSDFHNYFILSSQTNCFDVYKERSN